MRLFRLAFVAALAGIFCAQPQPAAAQAFTKDVFPEQRASFPGGVTAILNLIYFTQSGFQPLKLDVYAPAVTSVKHPFVIYVHGGGWVGGTSRNAGTFEDWPGTLASVAARGYVVASINYRLAGEAKFPTPEQDVKAAIKWLRVNAARFGADPARAAIWGGSAGGHLAGLAGTSCGAAALSPPASDALPASVSDCVQGAILWYPITDVEVLNAESPGGDNPALANMLGCKVVACAAGFAKSASPAAYIDANDPPVLLIHGDQDKTVPVGQSKLMYDALKAKGVKAELLIIPNVDHSFIGASREANLATNKMVMEKVNAFLDATVGAKSGYAKK
jgi:acetyl esterase/lipase